TYVQHGFQYQFCVKNWGGKRARSDEKDARKSNWKWMLLGRSASTPVTSSGTWLSTRSVLPMGSASPKYLRAMLSVSSTVFGRASAVASSPRTSSKSNTSKNVESTKKKRGSL